MQYKVLINLIVPETEESYEAYIPINKTIFYVSKLLAKLIETESKSINKKIALFLYDRRNGQAYESTKLIRETNIRNGSEIIAILQKEVIENQQKQQAMNKIQPDNNSQILQEITNKNKSEQPNSTQQETEEIININHQL